MTVNYVNRIETAKKIWNKAQLRYTFLMIDGFVRYPVNTTELPPGEYHEPDGT